MILAYPKILYNYYYFLYMKPKHKTESSKVMFLTYYFSYFRQKRQGRGEERSGSGVSLTPAKTAAALALA